MKVNLFALTGFGNNALKVLLKIEDINILKVYTRKEENPFPYYKEEQLEQLAFKNNIEVKYVVRQGEWEIDEKADLNLVVTFHRIFKKKHLSLGVYNINIHPSLLPSYRGPTPTNWMIQNGEKETGISVHYMNENIDDGDIIYQRSYPLLEETDSQLRKSLSNRIDDAIYFIVANYNKYKSIKSKYESSYFPSYYNG